MQNHHTNNDFLDMYPLIFDMGLHIIQRNSDTEIHPKPFYAIPKEEEDIVICAENLLRELDGYDVECLLCHQHSEWGSIEDGDTLSSVCIHATERDRLEFLSRIKRDVQPLIQTIELIKRGNLTLAYEK